MIPKHKSEVRTITFVSEPVQLTQGHAATLKIEMSNGSKTVSYSGGAPAMTLLWKNSRSERQFVPKSVYTPPAGFEGTNGLKGEYFKEANFAEDKRVVTRLDESLDFVWTWDPVAPTNGQHASSIMTHCATQFTSDAFLSGIPADKRNAFFVNPVRVLSCRLTLPERQQFVQKLIEHPDLLASMHPHPLAKLMESVYMLPNNAHLDLLAAWTAARPQPRCQMALDPVWKVGDFGASSMGHYWNTGFYCSLRWV